MTDPATGLARLTRHSRGPVPARGPAHRNRRRMASIQAVRSRHRPLPRTPAAPRRLAHALPVLLRPLLACALLLVPAGAPAQSVQALTERVERLEGEVAALREHLQALIGEPFSDRVFDVPVSDSPVRGPQDAPVTLVVFGDYASDYTVRAHYVLQRVLEAYPEDVRLVYKHYPLPQVHPMANEAALAALAAQRQDRYWQLHDLLMENSRRLDADVLLLLAEQAGLALDQFDADRRSLWGLERLAADERLAEQLSLAGVPTVFLNGRQLPTWRYNYLREQIERVLGR